MVPLLSFSCPFPLQRISLLPHLGPSTQCQTLPFLTSSEFYNLTTLIDIMVLHNFHTYIINYHKRKLDTTMKVTRIPPTSYPVPSSCFDIALLVDLNIPNAKANLQLHDL